LFSRQKKTPHFLETCDETGVDTSGRWSIVERNGKMGLRAFARKAERGSNMYRHGDVILVKVDAVPAGAVRRPSAVLARGEATGHSHRIAEPASVALYECDGSSYAAVLADSATLVHDEHDPIELPRGVYRFWQQREYSPQEIRRIVD
jgi:hypothetical protein